MIRCKCKLAFLFCLLLLDFLVKGQDTLSGNAEDLPIYEMNEVDIVPNFPGGERELLKFGTENFKFPESIKEQNPPSKGAISFVVETDGSLTHIKSLKPNALTEQMEDSVKKMPRWNPGKKAGQTVRVRYTWFISCIKWE